MTHIIRLSHVGTPRVSTCLGDVATEITAIVLCPSIMFRFPLPPSPVPGKSSGVGIEEIDVFRNISNYITRSSKLILSL